MRLKTLRSDGGFTYIATLVTVVVMGIMLAKGAEVWKTKMQRERETELLFRGIQIRDAMRRWYGLSTNTYGVVTQPGSTTVGKGVTTIPPNAPRLNELKDLLKAPSTAAKQRYLRKLYLDPITGKDFDVIKGADGRIIGVKSPSEKAPIKKGNFPAELFQEDFVDKKKYNEWQFICTNYPKPGSKSGGSTGNKLPGSETTPKQ